jgi:predicted MPP superfamily phosphohydrolase
MLPLTLLVLLHLYIGWRIAPLLPGPWGWVFAGLLAAGALLIPAAFLGRRAQRRSTADRWSWAGMLALGIFGILLVLTLARDALLLLAWPLGAVLPLPQIAVAAWPPLAVSSAQAVPLLAVLATLWGLVNARRTARVKRVDVPIAGLPPALHGFSIAQISDIHVGPTVKRPYLQAIVDRVNALSPDAIAITGDLVDGRVQDLHQDVAPLAALRARHGSFFVTGNHEYYSGAAEWVAHLRRLGVQVLMNEHVLLQQGPADAGGARLVLAGVTDPMAHHVEPADRSDPARAIAGAPADVAARVLLAHQPRSAPAAADAGFDLQLSGHTHGGQIWPFNFLVPLQKPYTAGLHRLRQLWIYTSRGTGYWGPPLRLGAPSEITLVRLVPAG